MGPLKPPMLPFVGSWVNLMRRFEFPTLYSSKTESSSQRLLDQSYASPHTVLIIILPHLGLGVFGPIRIPYPKGWMDGFTLRKIIILSNKSVPP